VEKEELEDAAKDLLNISWNGAMAYCSVLLEYGTK